METYGRAVGAVRAGSTLTYLLGDHLGPTSVATDSNGALLMETRYKPFGEVRYATDNATLPTRYTFTGQYSYVSDEATDAAGFGLIYFNARWMDPSLGRFAQADAIAPSAGDPQAWDRYAFVNNNPVRYTDPSGHYSCTDESDCEDDFSTQKQLYTDALKKAYKWNAKGQWSLKELQTIYQVARDIENYVNGITGGKGRAWMLRALANTNLIHAGWNDSHGETWPRLVGATIKLGKSWLSGSWAPKDTLSHEFGHVWDINTGNTLGIGGGPADEMSSALGGRPYLSPCRFCTGSPDHNNPPGHWERYGGYGSESINDYFAEGFSSSIYGGPMPPGVNDWIVDQISYEASFLP